MSRLGDLLIERGLLSERDRAEAEALRAGAQASLPTILLRMGAVSEDALLQLLSEQLSIPILDPEDTPAIEAVQAAISEIGAPKSWFVDHDLIIWKDARNGVLCAAGPHAHDPAVQEALDQWAGSNARIFLARSLAVEPILIALAGDTAATGASANRLRELAEEGPVIDFVNSVFAEALSLRASDIHFEPLQDKILVRLRVDGVLSQRRVAARDMLDAISSRIKLLSGMNIAERRLPQDGRQSIRIAGREIDVRVSSLPTTWGESIVVRLLGAAASIPELSELGLNEAQRTLMLAAINQPYGLVLVTGPTGSGKTTTVYRLLSQLNDGVRKIVTIEDPVEFNLPGILQMNVRSDIDLDFATGLRSILRQDPDVIFVGEIRDSETAKTAVQAALTGHLVISTLHTNSALAAIARLADLGVERFLLADVLRTVVAQRLVRRVCETCATSGNTESNEAKARQMLAPAALTQSPRWRSGSGCRSCGGTGFVGRRGVFEAAAITPSLQAAIRAGAAESELGELARADGFTSMVENAVLAARAGETTLTEALRVLGGA